MSYTKLLSFVIYYLFKRTIIIRCTGALALVAFLLFRRCLRPAPSSTLNFLDVARALCNLYREKSWQIANGRSLSPEASANSGPCNEPRITNRLHFFIPTKSGSCNSCAGTLRLLSRCVYVLYVRACNREKEGSQV